MKPWWLPCQVNLPDSEAYEVAGTGVRPQIVRCRADPSGRWAESAKRDQMGVCSGVILRWGSQPGSSLLHGTFQLWLCVYEQRKKICRINSLRPSEALCISKLTIIGSDNGLLPGRRQAIIWTNAGILLIGPLGTNFSEILIEIHTFPFKKMHLKMLSANGIYFVLALMC